MSSPLVKASKVSQWGNSAAVRLASATLARASIAINDPVEIVAGEGEIIIRKPRPRVRLDDLLARFDPKKHRHAPMLDDEPVGNETQ
jgi:antitoxin component of MazEF toxin-antitoxin module